MSGKEHMTIGTTAVIGMTIALIALGNMEIHFNLLILILGGVIGSYMPDIDSHKSTASQIFNKIFMILIAFACIFYYFGITFNYKYVHSINKLLNINSNGIIVFSILTILGKLSPHRMFTHKWIGTLAFCFSVYLMENKFLFLGFSTGYVLHIIADRITKNGKYLKFFECKLPMRNSKGKFTVSW